MFLQIPQRLHQEVRRIQSYLHSSTLPTLIKKVEELVGQLCAADDCEESMIAYTSNFQQILPDIVVKPYHRYGQVVKLNNTSSPSFFVPPEVKFS